MFKIKFDSQQKNEIKSCLNIEEQDNYKVVICSNVEEFEENKINIIFNIELLNDVENIVSFKSNTNIIRLIGKNERGHCHLELSDIFYIESLGNDVFAYTDETYFSLKEKLYQLEEDLGNFGFVRIGKSFLVNVSKIKYFKPTLAAKLDLTLTNGTTLEVNRSYVKSFKEYLNKD